MIGNLYRLNADTTRLDEAALHWVQMGQRFRGAAERIVRSVHLVRRDGWESVAADVFEVNQRAMVEELDRMSVVSERMNTMLRSTSESLSETQRKLDAEWLRVQSVRHETVGDPAVLLFWPGSDGDETLVHESLRRTRQIRGELDVVLRGAGSAMRGAHSDFEATSAVASQIAAPMRSTAPNVSVPEVVVPQFFTVAAPGAERPDASAADLGPLAPMADVPMAVSFSGALAGGVYSMSRLAAAVMASRGQVGAVAPGAAGGMGMAPGMAGGAGGGSRPLGAAGAGRRSTTSGVLRAQPKSSGAAAKPAAPAGPSGGRAAAAGAPQAPAARAVVRAAGKDSGRQADTEVVREPAAAAVKVIPAAPPEVDPAEQARAEREAKQEELAARRAARAERRAARLAAESAAAG